MEPAERGDLRDLTQTERWTRRITIAANLLLFAVVLAIFFIEPTLGLSLLSFLVFNIIFGREAAMALGSTLGLSPLLMFLLNVVQSLALGLLVYVVFIQILVHRPHGRLGRWARDIRSYASEHQKTLDRYGPLGIFFIMLVPFMSRPYLGAIAGRLAGLRYRRMILPVVLSTIVVSLVWAYSIAFMVDLASRVWDGSGILLTVLFAVGGLIATAYVYRQRTRKARARSRHTATD